MESGVYEIYINGYDIPLVRVFAVWLGLAWIGLDWLGLKMFGL